MEKVNIPVSIITVCYNSARTIERTVRSVLDQTYANFEYIIIDGASTDGTLEILKRYEPLFDGRMKIFSEPDSGIYDAMNKGIMKASGNLIGIINSDDFYEDNALEIMAKTYAEMQKKYVVLYGFQRNLSGEEEESVVLFHHKFLARQMITHSTCFVSRKVYEDFGKFDVSYKSSADYEFMLRIFFGNQVYFQPVYQIISNFQLGGMSSSQKGYRETAKLRYQYKSLSWLRYMRIVVKSRIYEFVHSMK